MSVSYSKILYDTLQLIHNTYDNNNNLCLLIYYQINYITRQMFLIDINHYQ